MSATRAIKAYGATFMVGMAAFLAVFTSLIICGGPGGGNATETATPVQTTVEATETQNRATVASASSPTATGEPTVTSTQTPTAEPTYCYTCTPTPITRTPAIIEVTALGGQP